MNEHIQVRGVHSTPNTTAVSAVIYEQPEDGEEISLPDIWTASPPNQLYPNTRTLKREWVTKTPLDEEAINLLLCCPSDEESRWYVNGMSGELSLLNIAELFLTTLSKDPFDTIHNLGSTASSSFLNSLSHPCAMVFTHLADNLLPSICSTQLKAQSPAMSSTDILKKIAEDYSGVVTPWTYWGGAGTPFPDHQEDGDLNSANFHIAGYPKVWIFKNATQTNALHVHFKG